MKISPPMGLMRRKVSDEFGYIAQFMSDFANQRTQYLDDAWRILGGAKIVFL
jgi:hypothetical protein